jgi:hypothetical protein
MTQQIPLNASPNQTLTVGLAGQSCQIDVFQRAGRVFVNLYVDDEEIILGVLAENRNRIVRDAYLGFSGDLIFVDTQGNADPEYLGLGSRYALVYLTAAEVAALAGD